MDPLLLTPAEIERRVFSWLQSSSPASPADWESLGPEGIKRLYAIAVTPRTGPRANRLRAAALVALGRLGAPGHILALLEVFEDCETTSIVRCGAIEGLGYLGMERALPLLQSQAYHSDFKVRLYAVGALARMPSALTRRIIADVSMRDPIQQVRRAARAELVRLEARRAESSPVQSVRDRPGRTLDEVIEAPSASLDGQAGMTLPSVRPETWALTGTSTAM